MKETFGITGFLDSRHLVSTLGCVELYLHSPFFSRHDA
jgi:hypothetical protein